MAILHANVDFSFPRANLSGGQIQLLALLRALLAKAKIVILDEGKSSIIPPHRMHEWKL
jgi:ABC-type multidrug transport system fused ATPase/permease subunit